MSMILLRSLQLTTGSTVISTVGALTATYKGTIVVHNEAYGQSATVAFKEGGRFRKGAKNGVRFLHGCLCLLRAAPMFLMP